MRSSAVVTLVVGLFAFALLVVPTVLYFLWHWLVPYFFPELPTRWATPPFWHVVGAYYVVAIVLGLAKASVTVKKDD